MSLCYRMVAKTKTFCNINFSTESIISELSHIGIYQYLLESICIRNSHGTLSYTIQLIYHITGGLLHEYENRGRRRNGCQSQEHNEAAGLSLVMALGVCVCICTTWYSIHRIWNHVSRGWARRIIEVCNFRFKILSV